MIYGLSTLQVVGLAAVVALVVGGVAWWVKRETALLDLEANARVKAAEAAGNDDEPGTAVDLEPPDVTDGFLGLIQMWRHRGKGARLAKKGYVRWYKLDARVNRPKWIKPSFDGTGEGEYHDKGDDVTYLFPREAMLSDARTGAWVAMHRRNEADPLNLRDPVMPAVPADRLQEIINLEAEAEKPGFLSGFDLSMPQIMIGGGVIIFLVYAAYFVMNGGL